MIHQVSSGMDGKLHELKTSVQEAERLNDILTQILIKHTKASKSKLIKDMTVDTWMTPQQALKYGIIDKIL
jgi:ATP-dependent Clp protease protease subunit